MRIPFDTHLHSSYSLDSETAPEAQILRAKELGLSGLCFTDHMDYEFPPDQCPGYTENPFTFDIDSYQTELLSLRKKYPELEIYIGVECGLQTSESVITKNKQLSGEHDFDQVIGSIHLIDKKDPYYEDIWKNTDPFSIMKRYFELTLENIRFFSDFDTLGHLDYAVRYAPKEFVYNPSDYFEITDEIMRIIIQKNIALEINTSSLKKGYGFTNPHPDFIKRYFALGGRMITIGSDAHVPDALAFGFDTVANMLTEIGFTEFVTFERRKPHSHHFNTIR